MIKASYRLSFSKQHFQLLLHSCVFLFYYWITRKSSGDQMCIKLWFLLHPWKTLKYLIFTTYGSVQVSDWHLTVWMNGDENRKGWTGSRTSVWIMCSWRLRSASPDRSNDLTPEPFSFAPLVCVGGGGKSALKKQPGLIQTLQLQTALWAKAPAPAGDWGRGAGVAHDRVGSPTGNPLVSALTKRKQGGERSSK